MRLFIAVALQPGATEALLRIRNEFSRTAAELRWTDPGSWHVTLQFLGSATTEQALCIRQKLDSVQAAQVPVRIAGLGFFERAGVFWAGVELTIQLLTLQKKITASTRGCGFVPEARTYNPHITLARTKIGNGARALEPVRAAVERSGASVRAEFVAAEFLLYESFLGPGGSQYQVRGRFGLN